MDYRSFQGSILSLQASIVSVFGPPDLCYHRVTLQLQETDRVALPKRRQFEFPTD